jgi:hypothetical protein
LTHYRSDCFSFLLLSRAVPLLPPPQRLMAHNSYCCCCTCPLLRLMISTHPVDLLRCTALCSPKLCCTAATAITTTTAAAYRLHPQLLLLLLLLLGPAY